MNFGRLFCRGLFIQVRSRDTFVKIRSEFSNIMGSRTIIILGCVRIFLRFVIRTLLIHLVGGLSDSIEMGFSLLEQVISLDSLPFCCIEGVSSHEFWSIAFDCNWSIQLSIQILLWWTSLDLPWSSCSEFYMLASLGIPPTFDVVTNTCFCWSSLVLHVPALPVNRVLPPTSDRCSPEFPLLEFLKNSSVGVP